MKLTLVLMSPIVVLFVRRRKRNLGTLQQVFSGSHYVRSFAGMMIIEEVLVRLKWEAFWETNKENASTYPSQVSHIIDLRNKLSNKD